MGRGCLCGALIALFATPALADPCKAIPDKGPLPKFLSPGKVIAGPVVYVGDGDSFCVAVGEGPSNLVEVRIADFYAPELAAPDGPAAKLALQRIASDRQVVCRAQKRSYDRIVARCTIDGVSIGERLRQRGIREGGNR